MPELHTNAVEVFVSPGAFDEPDGSSIYPYPTLGEALENLGRRLADDEGVDGAPSIKRPLEIVCIERPEGAFPGHREARHQYYVDPWSTVVNPDGTEDAPWTDFSTAVAEMAELHEVGALELSPGQRLRVTQHQVFTATEFERQKQIKETIAKYAFMCMAIAMVIPVVLILSYLTYKAWPALTPAFLLENPRDNMTAGGIWAPLVGTFFLVLGSLLIAAPIGILAGVYLNEYAPDNWFTRIINLAVVNLAGVPSIVHALFGVGAFVIASSMGRSLLAASCTVSVMTLPVIITSTKEALASVPMAFRVACWNMGASRWQTIRTIVLPNSISGILTGVILQVSRAAGETAPILFTGAMFYAKVPESGLAHFMPYGMFDRFMALSYHLYVLSSNVQGVSEGIQYGTAVVLIGMVLVVNSLSIGLRFYLRSRKKW